MTRILRAFSSLWWKFENRQQQQHWVRVIYRDDKPLITRYYIFSTRWIEDSEFCKRHPRLQRFLGPLSQRLVVHNAHESDADGLHDHPWPWASLILAGGYYENTPEGVFWRYPGHLRFRPARAFHRLVLDSDGKEVWSLFWMGRRERIWGFLEDDGTWRPWYEHDRARDPTMREAP
jgi:hypothetical protein